MNKIICDCGEYLDQHGTTVLNDYVCSRSQLEVLYDHFNKRIESLEDEIKDKADRPDKPYWK